MKSKTILNEEKQAALTALQEALKSDDKEKLTQSLDGYFKSVTEGVRSEYEESMYTEDKRVLMHRGTRQLTMAEEKYYKELIQAAKSNDPKQAFTNLTVAMPETIIADVFKNLVEKHPLLGYINFQNVSYTTTWILNDHTKQTAVWGDITEPITKEITSAFKKISTGLYKLSAYLVIDISMLELGPQWLDLYVRTILQDSIETGAERSIITGTGKNEPIGMDRDIHEGVSTTGGVYPKKDAIIIKSFAPAEYGPIVAKLVKTEQGRYRKFSEVLLICNQEDYLLKVMPATTLLNTSGAYSRDLFPFPTVVEISNELESGEALLCLPQEYFFGLGASTKEGVITYTDDLKFLEDQRVYKTKLHGNGKMTDNTCSVRLDISKLDPAYITVLAKQVTEPQPAVMKMNSPVNEDNVPPTDGNDDDGKTEAKK